MSANFLPTFGTYKETGMFKFWCQHVLPAVYDDSLSYYELLCRVVNYLNDVIENLDTAEGNIQALYDAFAQLQNYVNTYFEGLDVDEKINVAVNNKLDTMVLDGTLSTLVSPLVSTWLNANITQPTGVVIDRSLTVDGACADAGATGDRLEQLESMNYVDLLLNNITRSNTTHNGVTYTWNGNKCSLVGTASPSSFDNLITSQASVPSALYGIVGNDIDAFYDGVNSYLHFAFYKNGNIVQQNYVRGYQRISVPSDITGLIVRLYVANGLSVNETVSFNCSVGNATDIINGFVKPFRYVGILGADADIDALEDYTIAVTTTQTPDTPIAISGFIMTFGNNAGFRGQYWIAGSNGRMYYRAKTASSAYTNWIDQSVEYRNYTNAVCYYGPAPDDLNDCPVQSITADTGNRLNNPAQGRTGYVITLGSYSASHMQMFIGYMNGEMFYRRGLNGTWYDWVTDTQTGEGGNPNAKMLSVGDSILTGSVWKNGVIDHLSAYYNAPYSVVATAINVPKANETHILMSDTGMLHEGANGCFLDRIMSTDLSNYDALLTHLEFFDINEYPLGNANSNADRTTVAGAVKMLANYVKNSNRNTQLILVGVPPIHWRHAGANVFDGNYDQGYSIRDTDAVISQIAEDMHFTYITWEDFNMSYYWQDLTDGQNVHLNNENSYRVVGAYLGGRASAKVNF